jgi:hypothetical protein
VERQEKEIKQLKMDLEEERKARVAEEAMAKIKEMSERRMQTMEQIHVEFRYLRNSIRDKVDEMVKLTKERDLISEELKVAKAMS